MHDFLAMAALTSPVWVAGFLYWATRRGTGQPEGQWARDDIRDLRDDAALRRWMKENQPGGGAF